MRRALHLVDVEARIIIEGEEERMSSGIKGRGKAWRSGMKGSFLSFNKAARAFVRKLKAEEQEGVAGVEQERHAPSQYPIQSSQNVR